jgi:hypothetical protein
VVDLTDFESSGEYAVLRDGALDSASLAAALSV